MFKSEQVYRIHMGNGPHPLIGEKICLFQDIADKLTTLDFSLLGDDSNRREELIGDYQE